MSIQPNRKRVLIALASAAWLAACSAAWRGSTASGGDVSGIAAEVAFHVAAGSRLSAPCYGLARHLVEAGMRARIAQGRPTSWMLRRREEAALAEWDGAGCPARALPGIAFGVIDGLHRYGGGLPLPAEG